MATITKRTTKTGKTRWGAQIWAGRDPTTGRPQFISKTFELKTDAEKWARKQEGLKDEGFRPAVTKETLSAYLERWLKIHGTQVRARTMYDYKMIVQRWITPANGKRLPDDCPRLGAVRLDRLEVSHFDLLYVFLAERGLSVRSIRYVHSVLRRALKDAVKKELIPRNPTDFATVPKADNARDDDDDEPEVDAERAMDREQVARFIAAAKEDRLSPLWYVLITGGLRPSEANGLRWRNVDFEAGTVRITHALSRVAGRKWSLTRPKTKRSRRTVPLPPVTMKELKRWKAEQAKERLKAGDTWQDHGFVFTTETGAPIDMANVYTRNFKSVMRAAGLGTVGPVPVKPKGRPGPPKMPPFTCAFRMYDLRHTCATLLLMAGVPLKVVSERLGHSTIVLTADTYSHVLPTMQKEATEVMQAMIG